ncbi:mechanosensitive ion channel family protein [Kineosporia sp. R_H_3]|uniref:mechanosensitive ion channel family protein n=1 Tax=Kineosporia sp. R_H_3 TaxID=1961848 RepID=UPI001E5EE3E8|nr:mechanosensitive ion channel family protein [Kineosporia sp. R_H_3]
MLAAATPSPSPSPSPSFTSPLTEAAQQCDQGSLICSSFQDWFGSVKAGLWAQTLLGTPLRILTIVVLGLVLRYVLHRLIGRIAERIVTGSAGLGRLDGRLSTASAILSGGPTASARREQRARTTASVLKSLTTGVVMTVVLLMVLQTLGIPIGPILASAGILGVAVGFGSQALVKDFLSGIFMIVEDQYGVGDVVDLGEASGVVEAVGLRVTRLRDVDGAVWYVRNGEVLRVGNRSQGWARAVLDVGIAYGEDVDRASEVLLDVAHGLQRDPEFAALVLEDPEVTGVESVSAEGVVVRLLVKTAPMEQWGVARELRRRIKLRFDTEGIRAAYGPGAVVVHEAAEPKE